ncbi:pentapeptide repeat-containing protein [Streptomyces hundungensis]|uniref:pentapeptide repeat-containing protein n=1 Tax=Streptomyces hundungensis TaxID=1077946 RepID=UPI0033DE53B1
MAHPREKYWRSRSGKEQARAVHKALEQGAGLDGLDLSQVNGRWDLDGFRFPNEVPRDAAGRIWLHGVSVDGVSFRGAKIDGLALQKSTILGCDFENASCRNWGVWNSSIESTSFQGADLRGSTFGYVEEGIPNALKDVIFDNSRLMDCVLNSVVFDSCRLRGVDIIDMDIKACSFIDCEFEGDIRDSTIDGRHLAGRPFRPEVRGSDFSKARIRETEIIGYKLDQVSFNLSEVEVFKNGKATLDALDGVLGDSDRDAIARTLKSWAKYRNGLLRDLLSPEDILFIPSNFASIFEDPELVRRALSQANELTEI